MSPREQERSVSEGDVCADTGLRPFNWIGPRMDFIPGIDGPSEGVPRPLKLVDGGQSQRTFVYIKDAIEAVLLMIVEDVGNIRVGKDVHKVIKPSRLVELKQVFLKEKFLLEFGGNCINMVLEQDASGEDALRGWLVAAYAAQVESSSHELNANLGVYSCPLFICSAGQRSACWRTGRQMKELTHLSRCLPIATSAGA
ncbi:hypothetical protein Fmac_020920 [Flemingia macrophylla]|uniref:NAD-dependent epimerase/dehydratase domain-containing protein n=1 Tax=Flemingia macrophylla TaxID=520843 RepID=A0ABD1LVD5_9FABA